MYSFLNAHIANILDIASQKHGFPHDLVKMASPRELSALTFNAKPYPFTFPMRHTALLVIDMQRDFICPGGADKKDTISESRAELVAQVAAGPRAAG